MLTGLERSSDSKAGSRGRPIQQCDRATQSGLEPSKLCVC
jgi:hypothetical protein